MPRLDTGAVKLELNRRLTEWQNLLTAKARQITRKLIGIYEFKGTASYRRLIS